MNPFTGRAWAVGAQPRHRKVGGANYKLQAPMQTPEGEERLRLCTLGTTRPQTQTQTQLQRQKTTDKGGRGPYIGNVPTAQAETEMVAYLIVCGDSTALQ
mmetsp:Transcript_9033/g.27154  ORF Transcript_9033/g.27154 Transcript_9033/m.27154 type:complete len:100 (-) Transcript_9033:1299-1598(-)